MSEFVTIFGFLVVISQLQGASDSQCYHGEFKNALEFDQALIVAEESSLMLHTLHIPTMMSRLQGCDSELLPFDSCLCRVILCNYEVQILATLHV